MKVTFFEGDYGSEINLVPETVEEMSALLRMTKNAKAVKPEINTYLSKEPNCSVWIKSVSKVARSTSISSDKK